MIHAVNDGASKRCVAERFDVAPSTVVKLMQRWRQAGTIAPRPRGGDLHSGPIEAHAAEFDAFVAKTVDITLVEIADRLATTLGRRFAPSVTWRYLDRHEPSFKKTAHASEQTRADVAASRDASAARQPQFDPFSMVFVDETDASTKLTRARGRAERGQRCVAAVPSRRQSAMVLKSGARTAGEPHHFEIALCSRSRRRRLHAIEVAVDEELEVDGGVLESFRS